MRLESCIATLAMALLAAWRPAHSQSFVIPMELHKQRGDSLCWAATSADVVEEVLPAGSPLRPKLGAPLDQFVIAALSQADITAPGSGMQGFNTLQSAFDFHLAKCRRSASECDMSGQPLLYGLAFKGRAWNQPLNEDDLRKEIVDFKRPVMTTWIYEPPQSASWNASKHELIIFGYRVVERNRQRKVQLKIWNPLPVNRTAIQAVTDSTQLGTWRPYSYYVTPGSYYGRPVWRNADAFEIKVAATNVMGTWPASLSPSAPPLDKVDFAVARRAFEAQKARLLTDYIADLWPDPAAPARVTFAEPFPIVAPTIDELRAARASPASLLVARTTGLLVPVIENGQVVDSIVYSRVDGGWKVSGFSNVDVDRVLVDLRTRAAAPPDTFYMVAVPEVSAFFAARGLGVDARLVPVSGESAGFADKLLGQVVARIDGEIARSRNRLIREESEIE